MIYTKGEEAMDTRKKKAIGMEGSVGDMVVVDMAVELAGGIKGAITSSTTLVVLAPAWAVG
jgi:hypothetical protein